MRTPSILLHSYATIIIISFSISIIISNLINILFISFAHFFFFIRMFHFSIFLIIYFKNKLATGLRLERRQGSSPLLAVFRTAALPLGLAGHINAFLRLRLTVISDLSLIKSKGIFRFPFRLNLATLMADGEGFEPSHDLFSRLQT